MKVNVADRLAALRTRMQETGIDLVALGPGAHMHWVAGFHPHPDERPCLLLIGPQREAFLMPSLNAEGARVDTDIAFYPWSDDTGPTAALAAALDAVGASDAGVVSLDETMRADFALLLLGALPKARHGFAGETVGALRMKKSEAEYRELKMNARLDDVAMQTAYAAIRPGISERDIAATVRAQFAADGARPMFTIIGSGPNGAFPHHSVSDRVLQRGDAVVIDIGGSRGDFPSDMTRMAVVGEAPEGYAEVHAVVEAAVRAALAAARPGVRAKTVDAAARTVITDAGYGEYFVHRTGHGLGLEIHEPPYITSTSETVLEAGMVFSIEPGIYLPGRFGIRLEDIVFLREDGPEILSDLPRDVRVCG
ncbi:Xaa-Pro peptidase family protein [Aurantimonas sp. MSK8Z-1]|uniref:M24 family metallopeptidase n=1 Tax=Mangrovibrevibacter kandeliae TaxID=2968473 RepID=UPI00211774A1|nr:Xaa-Pro peptidase family protein [Aurantimonas sp. MSK8Z-1]MCW4115357.1 Xaa-Pro peptidase family protein [Aurantimonas sp. MSK8Z-1]